MGDLTLVLEASTGTGSLALVQGRVVIAESQVAMRGHDGERLMPALVQLLGDARVTTTALARIARIACGGGPGGFTSLRIAAAIAKGLAGSLGVELWAVSSLALLAAGDSALGETADIADIADTANTANAGDAANAANAADTGAPGDGASASAPPAQVIAILDALRGEWYAQRFTRDTLGAIVTAGEPALLGRDDLTALAAATGARIVGMGGDSFPGGRLVAPLARDLVRLSTGPLLAHVPLAEWEPDYGRLAEAQVKWEKAHGRALGAIS